MDEGDFYRRLKEEVKEWQRDGIIDSIQAENILKRQGVEEKGFRPGKVITALSILGSVLVGLGVMLFFASNWKSIPDFLKVIGLFLTTFVTYFVGYVMRFEKKTYPRVGHALLFLASIFVGVTIFLVGQIFHLNVDTHWLIFLWFIAVAPLGYVFESRPTLGLSILTFTVWITYLMFTTYTRISPESVLLFYMLFGIGLYGLGQLHELSEKWKRFRMVYKGFGIFFILLIYFYFSIRPTHPYYFAETGGFAGFATTPQLLLGVFALIAAVSIIYNFIEKEKLKSTKYELYVLLSAFVGWIFLFAIISYPQLVYEEVERYGRTYFEVNPDIRTILFVIFNLFLFGLSIGTVSIGYYKNQAPFVNIGVLFFALGVMQVYITHFQGMLPRSISMILGGVVLLVLATILEKKRKSLLSAMKGT